MKDKKDYSLIDFVFDSFFWLLIALALSSLMAVVYDVIKLLVRL